MVNQSGSPGNSRSAAGANAPDRPSGAAKGTIKENVLGWAGGALVKATDPASQRKIVSDVRQMLDTSINQGKSFNNNNKTGEWRITPGQ